MPELIPYQAEQQWLTEPEPRDLDREREIEEEKADMARDRELDKIERDYKDYRAKKEQT